MPKGDKLKLKADPDDGTTPVAHLLLEAVAIANLNGTEKGLILYLWRQTYGWLVEGKRSKEARIPQEELADRMGASARTVYGALKALTDNNIFVRRDLGQGKGYIYRMNTDIPTWKGNTIDLQQLRILSKVEENIEGSQFLLPLNNPSTVAANESNGELLPRKKTTTLPLKKTSGRLQYYKEILNQYKESNLSTVPADEVSIFLTYKLTERMLQNNPKVKIPEDLSSWINDIRLMLERDKRTPEEILRVIEFCQNDSFWKSNVLSTGKLREKFDQLYMKMESSAGGYHGTNAGYKKQPAGTSETPRAIDGDAEASEG